MCAICFEYRRTPTRASPITPRRLNTSVGDIRLEKPSRTTGMDARTITRAHYCILECIHVEVATIARGPWSGDARPRGCLHPPPGVGGSGVARFLCDDAERPLTSYVDSSNLPMTGVGPPVLSVPPFTLIPGRVDRRRIFWSARPSSPLIRSSYYRSLVGPHLHSLCWVRID
jgi:hypothetical protein